MRTGMGVIGWPPDVFWSATLPELVAASDGWRISQGDDKVDGDGAGLPDGRLGEMMARYPDSKPDGD